jgi:UDPglucose 6-dehydrogenase
MAHIEIVGAGVLGQATGKGLARWGHRVVFCDTDKEVLDELAGEGYEVCCARSNPSSAPSATLICVPTPTVHGEASLKSLWAALARVSKRIIASAPYQLVVIRSTVPPGTTEKAGRFLESASGKKAGVHFGICHNPEFLRAASAEKDFLEPPLILVGASDDRSAAAVRSLYVAAGGSDPPIVVTDPRTTEMVKYVCNLYNAAKISFSNEVWLLCRSLGIEGDVVMSCVSKAAEGMWNPAYGIRGGSPYGGSCLPKDVEAFLGFVRRHGLQARLVRAVHEVNKSLAPATTASPSIRRAPADPGRPLQAAQLPLQRPAATSR